MGKILDLREARERKGHELKEAKVRKLRDAFKAVRESWEAEGKPAGKVKGLRKKKKKRPKK